MVIPQGVPSEDAFMDAVRSFNMPAGDYAVPCPTSARAARDPAFVARMKKGPVTFMTVRPAGNMRMGGRLLA